MPVQQPRPDSSRQSQARYSHLGGKDWDACHGSKLSLCPSIPSYISVSKHASCTHIQMCWHFFVPLVEHFEIPLSFRYHILATSKNNVCTRTPWGIALLQVPVRRNPLLPSARSSNLSYGCQRKDGAGEEAEQRLQKERIQISFSIFAEAERSSAIQTNCACLCCSGFGGFGGGGSFLYFYARKETPKEDCQNYPAVPQMVLLQTL